MDGSPASSPPATNLVKFVSSAFQKLSPRAVFLPNHEDFSVKLLFEPWDIRSVKSFRTSIRTAVMKIDPLLSFWRNAPIDSQYLSLVKVDSGGTSRLSRGIHNRLTTKHTTVYKEEGVKILLGFAWTDTEYIQKSHSGVSEVDRHSLHDLNVDQRQRV